MKGKKEKQRMSRRRAERKFQTCAGRIMEGPRLGFGLHQDKQGSVREA